MYDNKNSNRNVIMGLTTDSIWPMQKSMKSWVLWNYKYNTLVAIQCRFPCFFFIHRWTFIFRKKEKSPCENNRYHVMWQIGRKLNSFPKNSISCHAYLHNAWCDNDVPEFSAARTLHCCCSFTFRFTDAKLMRWDFFCSIHVISHLI